jgi:hypothetical protein
VSKQAFRRVKLTAPTHGSSRLNRGDNDAVRAQERILIVEARLGLVSDFDACIEPSITELSRYNCRRVLALK